MGQSRNENILENMLGAHNELGRPQSRIEQLLMWLLEQGGGGGGQTFAVAAGELDNQTVPAQGRVNLTVPINLPDGMTIKAFRGITIQKASESEDSSGFKNVMVQFFATTGGGTKAQVALRNISNTDTKVKVSVIVLAGK